MPPATCRHGKLTVECVLCRPRIVLWPGICVHGKITASCSICNP